MAPSRSRQTGDRPSSRFITPPNLRSTRVVTLIDELGAPVEIREVTIPRRDGSGGRDPAEPHLEGKVPLLVNDGALIRETPAILHHQLRLEHRVIETTFRGPGEALAAGPYALGSRYSAADLLLHSPFALFPEAAPDDPAIRD